MDFPSDYETYLADTALGFDSLHQAMLDDICNVVVVHNLDAWHDAKSGKTASLGYLVGQVMEATGGKANPVEVQAKLRKKLTDDSFQ